MMSLVPLAIQRARVLFAMRRYLANANVMLML